jgi:hypothetical protein
MVMGVLQGLGETLGYSVCVALPNDAGVTVGAAEMFGVSVPFTADGSDVVVGIPDSAADLGWWMEY